MNKAIKKEKKSAEDEKFPLPVYDEKEDIYNKEKEISLEEEIGTEKNKNDPGSGLDVPGSELDDEEEKIGEEDEENNYYSLGGDDHEDLEETNDDNR